MRPIKEKLWTVLTTERGQVKVSMNGVPLSSKSGESYGILQEVCCTTQSGKGMIQLTFRQDGSSHKKRKVAILHSRYYDRFHSSPPFNECASKDADHLAEELSKALNVHKESSSPQSSQLFHPEESVLAVNSAEKSKEHNNASKVDTPPNIDSQTFLSHDTETPVATNQPQRHKKRLSFTPEDQVPDKKSKKDTCSSLMQSCDDCLVSASSHFINIDKLELPSKVRQFRRVNESFLNSLEGEMERNPAGSYGALFVVAKGLSSKIEWKEEEKNKHSYEVLGGTHLSLATKRLHEKYPENPHFAGRMSRIYVGLSDEQAVYLGGMHQHSSMFQHEVTYREEVERCRMQLFGDRDITGEPPEPRPSWRDDCSLILGKEKKSLSEIFAMAKVSKAVWKEFQEVNSLFEMGRLKEQKVSSGEIVRGAVSLKQWHMKPLCSLTDEQRLPLLLKLKEKKISLKEVKEEAYKLKALSQVREAIVKFFKLNSWQEAETKFGASVHPERLLRFKGDFEKLHEFKMFLKHLKQKIEWADTDYANTDNCIVGPDGVTKGRVVFIKQHEDVDQNSAFLESGAFLSIAHVGYTDQDVVSEIKDVVELVVRINFKRLMTIFNIVFICPVGIYCEVQEAVSLQGAAKTQCGFIVNKIPPLAREDLLMTEVVECFVVCHWAVSYNKLTERHVSRAATNVIEVIKDGSCQPRELYESLIETFSKEGDLVLDIGSANGNGMLAAVRLKRPSVSINKHTTEDVRWHLLENIREKNHFPLE